VILVVVAQTGIQVLFLPLWAVFPWLFEGYALPAYVPRFVDLIAFAGLAFSAIVLLPCVFLVFTQNNTNGNPSRMRIVSIVLSSLVVLFPLGVETFGWDQIGGDLFFHGFSLTSPTWWLRSSVSGQGGSLYFSTSSLFELIYWGLVILPGILFAWSVCQFVRQSRKSWIMLPLGIVHIMILALVTNWINITTIHPGTWVMYPFPSLLVGGFVIAVVHWAYSRRKEGSDEAHDVLTSIRSSSER
jgi:hypothetical protein